MAGTRCADDIKFNGSTSTEVMGHEFSHEGVNSEHISYDQYEQEEEKHEEVDVDYMDEDNTNVEPMFDYHGFDEGYNIDSLEDIGMIEFWNIRDEDRKPTPEPRCGCSEMMEIRLDAPSSRWFISYFSDEHNHLLLDLRLTGLLRGHRFMSEVDIGHMINMKKGGISVGQIYQALANQEGGYEYLSFTQRDMYKKIAKERHQLPGDAYAALKYLEDQATNDPSLYFNHHMDADGTLRNLFWYDGLSRADYSLFSDVLAFDATYKRNKYMCPFGDTYRWLLQQLKVAMNGKAPVSVITDGDLSMKFAIEKEFPNAHHRLCAWHLIRNATSNIGKPQFTSMFKKCILGDYEIDVFRQKWFEMVEGFGVENKNWVLDMYKKRHSWATAHIRGKFFASFRTTSRCDGLNSIIAKYVNSRYNLVEFIQHFNRCVDHIRWKEIDERDFCQ
ncbi:protein FAR1-RELATED SEQUENCE 5-like [Arachis ipaensis]|uniref:protein FAR1-RELATED SEQUENCE 5-like n=1 Tax=Arachis ipaensis TaxID=130454 RepID=UPI0007AF7766|nr:protein FAR1-RELATED SEQUENCE 5-like [Arachis ipaensis]XP_025635920.1 protein FAR1-RELATED SEQUENCE 5-like [Arachis hypogaea]